MRPKPRSGVGSPTPQTPAGAPHKLNIPMAPQDCATHAECPAPPVPPAPLPPTPSLRDHHRGTGRGSSGSQDPTGKASTRPPRLQSLSKHKAPNRISDVSELPPPAERVQTPAHRDDTGPPREHGTRARCGSRMSCGCVNASVSHTWRSRAGDTARVPPAGARLRGTAKPGGAEGSVAAGDRTSSPILPTSKDIGGTHLTLRLCRNHTASPVPGESLI